MTRHTPVRHFKLLMGYQSIFIVSALFALVYFTAPTTLLFYLGFFSTHFIVKNFYINKFPVFTSIDTLASILTGLSFIYFGIVLLTTKSNDFVKKTRFLGLIYIYTGIPMQLILEQVILSGPHTYATLDKLNTTSQLVSNFGGIMILIVVIYPIFIRTFNPVHTKHKRTLIAFYPVTIIIFFTAFFLSGGFGFHFGDPLFWSVQDLILTTLQFLFFYLLRDMTSPDLYNDTGLRYPKAEASITVKNT